MKIKMKTRNNDEKENARNRKRLCPKLMINLKKKEKQRCIRWFNN